MIGETLGKYRVMSRLGTGGMGAVYLGEHVVIGRKAAIKVLLPEFSHKREIVERFFNEAKAGTAIGHPGIVQIFDFGEHSDGSAFLVMELLVGEALNERLDRLGRLSEDDALRIARQCASALVAAHTAGIVHRDLKPANIFLATDPEMEAGERVKILDFGIAKLTDSGAAGDLRTRTGSMMGTPAYMSPEQCRGAGLVDHRSDIYSLGCVIFRMVCGRPPFVAEGVGDIIASHLREPAPSLRAFAPAISTALEAVVQRTLSKSPDARFSSMAELATVLQSMRHGGAHQPATMYRRPETPAPPGTPAIIDQQRALPAAPPAAAMLPPAQAQHTAFQTNRPSSGTDMLTTPLPAHLDQPYPRGAMPDPTTLGSVASQRMQAVQRTGRRGLVISGAALTVFTAVAVLIAGVGEEDPAGVASGPGSGVAAETLRPTGEPGSTASSGNSPAPAGSPAAAGRAPEGPQPAPPEQPAEADRASDTATSHASASGTALPSPERPGITATEPQADEPGARLARVRIESTPAGAAVHAPGRRDPLGVTPFDYERSADAGAVTLTLQHEGYEPEKVEIPAGHVRPIAVTLQRVAERTAERKPARKPPQRPERKPVPKSDIDDGALTEM